MLVTVWFYFFMVITAILCSTGVLIMTMFDPKGDSCLIFPKLWGMGMLTCLGIKPEVHGLEKIDPNRPYIYAANHQGAFDIFVLLAVLPPKIRFLAKKELFSIPLFGPALGKSGSLPIDRSNRQSAMKSIDQAARAVRNGRSIIIFPEGTRSATADMLPFKKGGFVLAIKSGQPIVPVSISGSRAVLPRGWGRVRPGPIKVVFGQPIPTDTYKSRNKHELMDLLREAIAKNYEPDFPQPDQNKPAC